MVQPVLISMNVMEIRALGERFAQIRPEASLVNVPEVVQEILTVMGVLRITLSTLHVAMNIPVPPVKLVFQIHIWVQMFASADKVLSEMMPLKNVAMSMSVQRMAKRLAGKMPCARIYPEVTNVTAHLVLMETRTLVVTSVTVWNANVWHPISLLGVSAFWQDAMMAANVPRVQNVSQ